MSKAKPIKPSTPLPPSDASTSAAAPADPTASLTHPSLVNHLATAQSQLLALRSERNFLQQESSLLLSHHSTLVATNDRTRAHLSNLQSQLERMGESHRSEIRVLRQKEEHTRYEEQATLNRIAQEEEKQQTSHAASHSTAVSELNSRLAQLAVSAQQASAVDEREVREMQDGCKKELTKLQENFDRVIDSLHQHYRSRVKELEESMALREKVEWHEIEERSNRHLLGLKQNYEENYAEIKEYYQSITSDNIQLIRELQAEIVEIKASQERKEAAIVVLLEQSVAMNVPLLESNKTKAMLEAQLANYGKNKTSLGMLKRNHAKKQQQLAQMQAAYHQLNAQFAASHEQTQQLLSTPLPAALPPPAALAAAVSASQQLYDMRRAQLSSVLTASELPAGLVSALYAKLDELLGGKERVLQGLEYERQRVRKGMEDMRRVMEAKLGAAGVKRERRTEEWVEGRGTQPAGLIVR